MLCKEYADTINPNPGRYNGYNGEFDNSINFISTPPPSVKARLPKYTVDKLKLMAKLMDKLESMGVLAGLYTGFFGRGGSIARNPFSRHLYVSPKFLELLTWELSWVEDYRQSNTTSEA